MSWELIKPEQAYSASPGMNQFDDYIRKNVVMTTLEDMIAWSRKNSLESYSVEDQIKYIATGLGRFGPDAGAMLQLLDGLERIPEGKEWLKTNLVFLAGVKGAIEWDLFKYSRDKLTEAERESNLLSLSNCLYQLNLTNAIFGSTSTP